MIVNEIGLIRAKVVKKELYKTIFIGPLYAIFMLTLIYLSTLKNIIAFYILGLFFVILFLMFMVYAPYRMMKRHAHTIYSVGIENKDLTFSTFPTFWIGEKKYTIPMSNLKIKKSHFTWYGKNSNKDGLTIVTKDDQFYLVKDFFDDYESFVGAIPQYVYL